MFTEIKTIITTKIDLESFESDHSVTIEAEDVLPQSLIYAAVVGACKSATFTLEKKVEDLTVEEE